MIATPPPRKQAGPILRTAQILGAVLAVLILALALALVAIYATLTHGPISLQPLVPLLKAQMELQVGKSVDLQGLQLALGGPEGGDVVVSAGPIEIGAPNPAQIARLVVRIDLPFALDAAEMDVAGGDVPTMLAAWPDILLPDVRAQVADLVKDGTIQKGRLRYRFHDAGPADLDLDIEAINALVTLPNGMPEVTAPSAKAVIADGILRVTAPKASAAGLVAQTVDVTIDHILDDAPSRLTLNGDIDGEAGQLYRVLSEPPLSLVPRDMVEVGTVRGHVTGKLSLAMPLAERIRPDDVELQSSGRYRNLSGVLRLPVPLELTKGAGTFSVTEGAIEVRTDAELFGSPVNVFLQDRWRGRGAPRRIEARGSVDRALLERVGLEPPEIFEGKALVHAILTQAEPPVWTAEIEGDLKEARIEEPNSGLHKPLGEEGWLKVLAKASTEKDWSVERFDMQAGEQKALGSLRPAETGTVLRLEQFVTPRMDLTADLLLGPDMAVSGSIAAKRLRMPPDDDGNDPKAQAVTEAPPTPIDLDIYVDRFETEGDPLLGVKGKVRRNAQGFQDIDLAFDLGGPGRILLAPEGNAHHLELTAPDAGGLLLSLGAGKPLIGGDLKIVATVKSQVPEVVAEGRLDLANTAIRMTGEDPTPFRKIVIPFAIDGPKVTLTQVRMTGGVLGLRLSGTLDRQTRALNLSGEATPLYPINRFVGQIPILGRILGGAKGLGAINADFTVGGTLDAPDARVAASSILLPGSVRDILRAIEPR